MIRFRIKILVLFGLLFLFAFQMGCGHAVKEAFPVPVITAINGGISGSGTVGSLFIIDGAGFTYLPAATPGYAVSFRNASNEVVASATVNFTYGDWLDIFIIATVPNGLTAGTTYKVTVTTPGGTSNAVNFLVVASVAFSPSGILWSQTSSLPKAMAGFPTVIATIGSNDYIYTLGGNTASTTTLNGKAANLSDVYFNQMNRTSGAIKNASWQSAASLPEKRGFHNAVIANSYNSLVSGNGTIYVLGGLDGSGEASNKVYFANLNSNGTISTWDTTTPLPLELFAAGAVIFNGRIYVAGGNNKLGNPKSGIYSARILSDGSLEPWRNEFALNAPTAYYQLVTAAGYMYVICGDIETVDPITNTANGQDNISYNKIGLNSGAIVNPWNSDLSTGKGRDKHSAVVAGSYILLSGGLYNGDDTGASEQSYASINPNGSLSSFIGATGSHTISKSTGGYNFYNHSSAYFVDSSGKPHVLILGGGDVNTGAPHAEVWYQHD